MRYADRATLIIEDGKEYYDVDLGRMVGSLTRSIVVWCNISSQGINTQTKLTDKLIGDDKVIRIKGQYNFINYVLVDGKKFMVTTQKRHGNDMTLYVSEVLPNG